VKELAKYQFSLITREKWASVCMQVEEIVNNYIEREHLMDSILKSCIINVWLSDSDTNWEDEVEYGILRYDHTLTDEIY
jgi:hypothetical protein